MLHCLRRWLRVAAQSRIGPPFGGRGGNSRDIEVVIWLGRSLILVFEPYVIRHVAIDRGESYQTLPFVRPGGGILPRISGWPKVERVCLAPYGREQHHAWLLPRRLAP